MQEKTHRQLQELSGSPPGRKGAIVGQLWGKKREAVVKASLRLRHTEPKISRNPHGMPNEDKRQAHKGAIRLLRRQKYRNNKFHVARYVMRGLSWKGRDDESLLKEDLLLVTISPLLDALFSGIFSQKPRVG